MSDAHESDDTRIDEGAAEEAVTQMPGGETQGGFLVSRRAALVGGALGVAAVLGVGELDPEEAFAATTGAASTSRILLPTTGTAPEQLRLAWGADPTTEVTVSWSSPGTAEMPAPTLAYSRSPISARNPGTVVTVPATASPLDLTQGPRTTAVATSFADGLSGQTTYHYHVPLSQLEPNTQYYYEVNDGAGSTPASGQFFTAPAGRAAYRFTAFGDIGTPYTNNPSGYNWTESSDVSVYTVDGVINPGDGQGPGLFHLMLGDLSYANVNPGSQPAVWRDYQVNASAASANQPWMPIMGNHEVELGISSLNGVASTGPFIGTYAGPFYNGPYGAGNYLARHLLPDNGLTNTDGNTLQGSFYSFQVGTVLFICLNTNDVAFQNPQTVSTGTSGKTPFSATYANNIVYSNTPATDTPTVTQYLATGDLAAVAENTELVPDTASGKPHLQTQWLESQLQAARAPGSSVDMIVVCEHHCALSSGPSNGCDLGIRAAWLPLYDQYEVDLVLGGHDHDYEASYPVRGYDQNDPGVATAAFTDPWGNTYASGAPVNTRRPTVVQTEPTTLPDGKLAWNTGGGTVYLQLGAAGAAAGKTPTLDTADGLRSAVVWAKDTGVGGTQCAKEDATWSRVYDSSSNYGYAVFDVDPGDGPGQTKLTYQWFSVPMPTATGDQEPAVTTAVLYGTDPTLPTTPYEEFVFMRSMSGQVSISGGASGAVQVDGTVSASPSGWPSDATYDYQWLRNGTEIDGARDATYKAVPDDDGQELSVRVTAHAQSFPDTAATSAALTVTDGTISLAVPTISGNAVVGQMLTASANVSVPGAVYSYQWLLDGSAISGATGDSYTPSGPESGHMISVQVTVSAPSYQSTTATSAAVKVITVARTGPAPGLDVVTVGLATPTINGTPQVGRTLTAGVSASSGTVSYQWLLDGSAISGATSSQYTPVGTDAGHDVQLRIASAAAAGASAMSAAVRIATAHFARTAKPRVHGSAIVGRTVTVEIGAWSPKASLAYQWLLNGHPIRGATKKTLKVERDYAGKKLRVRVTGTSTGYTTTTIVSPTVAVSETKQKHRKPKISGKAIVGETLHAHIGEWLPGTEFSYRWLAGGREVAGASGHSFRIQPELRGKRIAVEVTARLAGQEDVNVRSAETRPVRRPWSWL